MRSLLAIITLVFAAFPAMAQLLQEQQKADWSAICMFNGELLKQPKQFLTDQTWQELQTGQHTTVVPNEIAELGNKYWYTYSHNGISIEYTKDESQGTMPGAPTFIWAMKLTPNQLPSVMGKKSYFINRFKITEPLSDTLELGCDSNDLTLRFKGEYLIDLVFNATGGI